MCVSKEYLASVLVVAYNLLIQRPWAHAFLYAQPQVAVRTQGHDSFVHHDESTMMRLRRPSATLPLQRQQLTVKSSEEQVIMDPTMSSSLYEEEVAAAAPFLSSSPPPAADSITTNNKNNNMNDDDDSTAYRWIRTNVPVKWQYFIRDSGLLRALHDSILVPLSAVSTILPQYPAAWSEFWRLSLSSSSLLWWSWMRMSSSSTSDNNNDDDDKVALETIRYGSHSRNVMDVLQPKSSLLSKSSSKSSSSSMTTMNPLVVFVHGGAWGSGYPAMYRLVAIPFLAVSMSVAILGYRTYPDATVHGQVQDFLQAMQVLKSKYSDRPLFLMGHSTGSHLISMALVSSSSHRKSNSCGVGDDDDDWTRGVVGIIQLAGVYDIPRHFVFESQRGVDRFSPLAMACAGAAAGGSSSSSFVLSAWKYNSPTRRIMAARSGGDNYDAIISEKKNNPPFPPQLVLHGTNDTTVPHWQSVEYVSAWNQRHGQDENGNNNCELRILEGVGHADPVMDLMFGERGGPTGNLLLEWINLQLLRTTTQKNNKTNITYSNNNYNNHDNHSM